MEQIETMNIRGVKAGLGFYVLQEESTSSSHSTFLQAETTSFVQVGDIMKHQGACTIH